MKKKFLSILSLILALTMIFPMGIAVSADTTGEVTITPDKSVIYDGGNNTKAKFTIKIPAGAVLKSAVYSSGYSNVITVTQDGNVTAVGVGKASVVCQYSYEVTVAPATEGGQPATELKSGYADCDIDVKKYEATSIDFKDTTVKNYVEGQTVTKDKIHIDVKFSDDTVVENYTKFSFSPEKIDLKTKEITVKLDDYPTVTAKIGITVAAYDPVDYVKSISIDSPKADKTYNVGDKLSASDVLIKVTDVDNKVSYIKPSDNSDVKITGITFTNGSYTFSSEDAKTNPTLTVTYGGKSASLTLKVQAKETPVAEDYEYRVNILGSLKKTEYKVGEKFTTEGVSVQILRVNKKTGAETVFIDSIPTATLDARFNKTFTSADIGKVSELSAQFSQNDSLTKKTCTVTITVKDSITVVSSSTELDVYEITDISFDSDKYAVGYKLSLSDIEYFKYREKNSRGEIKTVYYRDFENITNDLTVEVLDKDGDTKSRRFNVIEEDDVLTDKRDRTYVNVLFTVDKETYETTLYVGETSKVQFIYDGDLITTYDDIGEALSYTAEQDKNVKDSFELDRVRDTRSITLKLGEDQKSRIREFSDLCHNVVIDLNGYSMAMDSDAISISSENRDYTLVITNTSSTAAEFTYYDEDITITLAKGESLEFKYDRDTKKTTVPGIYSAEVTCGANGSYSSTPKADSKDIITFAHGTEIKFTFTPKKGYEIDTITVGGKAVAEKDYTVSSSGVVSYTLKGATSDTTVKVTFKEEDTLANWDNPFTDVSERNSYYEAVSFVYQNELFKGTSTDKFSPNTSMTRAMFVTVLGRLAGANVSRYSGKSSFSDVDKDPKNSASNWYAPYVQWAVDNGIVEGYGDGKFGPNNKITHQQMYVIMYRYTAFIAKKSVNLPTGAYISAIDADDVADWALKETKFASENGYLVKNGSRIEPAEEATRAELATLLLSYCKNVLGWENGKK